jgi:hypothetical protein
MVINTSDYIDWHITSICECQLKFYIILVNSFQETNIKKLDFCSNFHQSFKVTMLNDQE